MKILSIVGARPQFVKLAVICRSLASLPVEHRIVHTGQHYDALMSDVFFRELDIPEPDYNLEVGSGSHGEQTGEMMKRLEPVLIAEQPRWTLLYGDTNSTLAGATVAAKLHLPSAHIEAGLRSYNRRMPEEINRIVADHLSDILFCPTSAAMRSLSKEGLEQRAVLSGDVMLDAAFAGVQRAETENVLTRTWRPREYALATVHRAENTDDPVRLKYILDALENVAVEICPVALPVHPRTRRAMAEIGWKPRYICVIPPVSYFQMLLLERNARLILTDSGGVQKEAYFFQVPCITLRDDTEWTETQENSCNTLAGCDEERILQAAYDAGRAGPWVAHYGDGDAGGVIGRTLMRVDGGSI